MAEYKKWSDLSEEEKEALRKRWTPEKIEAILKALKEKKPLPDFFRKLPLSEEDRKIISPPPTETYDLRGISLHYQDLKEVDLRYAHLEGAIIIDAHLEGADLLEAHLEGAYLRAHFDEKTRIRNAYLSGTLMDVTELEKTKDYSSILLGESPDKIPWNPLASETSFRNLKSFFKSKGIDEIAQDYHFRYLLGA